MEDVPGIPPAIGLDPSVAERIASNITKAHAAATQDLLFPGSENLYVVFRSVDDFAEFRDRIVPSNLAMMPESQAEVQMAINTLVVSSVGSYAMVEGERHEIGHPLGLRLYSQLFLSDGGVPPQTDGEAVALMFGADTLSLVMFARSLRVWQKVQGALLEQRPGESWAATPTDGYDSPLS